MQHKLFLLADDDFDDFDIFKETLDKSNIPAVVEYAPSGEKALLFLKNSPIKPDLIFLDINMPNMNGWECLSLIKSNPDYKDIPVMMYTVSDRRKDNDHALNAGAMGMLTKPNDYNTLVKLLGTIAETKNEEIKAMLENKAIHYS